MSNNSLHLILFKLCTGLSLVEEFTQLGQEAEAPRLRSPSGIELWNQQHTQVPTTTHKPFSHTQNNTASTSSWPFPWTPPPCISPLISSSAGGRGGHFCRPEDWHRHTPEACLWGHRNAAEIPLWGVLLFEFMPLLCWALRFRGQKVLLRHYGPPFCWRWCCSSRGINS